MTWPISRPPPFAEWRNADPRLMPFTVGYKKEYSRYRVECATPTLGSLRTIPRVRRGRLSAVGLHWKCNTRLTSGALRKRQDSVDALESLRREDGMAEFLYPGVYVEETGMDPKPIAG